MSNSELCEFIKQIQKDPSKKVTGLTIRKIKQLQEHLKVCEECFRITDEILEAGKNVPEDSNSEWNRSQYN